MNFSALRPDEWSLALSLSSGNPGTILSFKTLVDDEVWQIGANIRVIVPRAASAVDVYPFFMSTSGTYQVLPGTYYSPQLRNERQIVVYTPPSYFENTLKTIDNILIMHDGQNLFNDSTSFLGIAWHCQDTVDTLVVEGNMEEVIIIGVYNTINRTDEYTYSFDSSVGAGGQGDLYLDFLVETVLPEMQQRYRVAKGREKVGILGSSLGGLISCYAGWTRADVFGKAGCMSSSFWWNNEDFDNVILHKYPKPAEKEEFYLDSGNAGPDNDDVTQTITVRNHMLSLDFVMNRTLFYYLDKGGMHNEKYWGARFHVPMTDLYPPELTQTQPLE